MADFLWTSNKRASIMNENSFGRALVTSPLLSFSALRQNFGCTPNLSSLVKRFAPKVFLKFERKDMQLNRTIMPLSLAFLGVTLGTQAVQAQISETLPGQPGATNTGVDTVGTVTNITGGETVGTNLFHSFSQFSLPQNETANFQTPAAIANVLSRVTGGSASVINGQIQLSGNTGANLYLMNPSGIIFGPNATLSVPASFVATTGTAIGFQDNVASNVNYFNAVGNNVYANLTGGPTSLLFPPGATGAIVNLGNLTVPAGENNTLALFGNTVLQGVDINAPGANVIAASLPNPRVVRLAQPGNLLSLEFPGGTFAGPNLSNVPGGPSVVAPASIATLPALITGGNFGATSVQVNGGVVTLAGAGGGAATTVNAGDLVTRNVNISAAGGGAAGPNAGSVIFISGGNLVAGNIANGVANGANIALQGSTANGGTLRGGTVRLASGFFQGQGNGNGTLNVGNILDTANINLESGGGIVGGSLSTRGVTAGRNDAITLTSRTGNIQVINLLANNANAAGAAGTGGNIVVNVPAGTFQSSGTLSNAVLAGGGAAGAGNAGVTLTTIAGAGGAGGGGAASVAARGTININQLGGAGGGAGANFIQGANLERDVNGNIIYRLASDQTIRVLINGVNADGSLILANATTGTVIPGGGNVVIRSIGAAAPAITGGGGSQGLIIRLNGANTAFNGSLGLTGVPGSTGVTVQTTNGAVASGNPAAGVFPGATAVDAGGTVVGGPAFGGPGAPVTTPPPTGGPAPVAPGTPVAPVAPVAPGTGGVSNGGTTGGGNANGGGTTTTGGRTTTASGLSRLQSGADQAQDQIELSQTGNLSGAAIAAATPSGSVFTGDVSAATANEGVLTRRVARQVEVPIVEKEKELPVVEEPKQKPVIKVLPQLW
jgi:filamentous hemagglutinin family protein